MGRRCFIPPTMRAACVLAEYLQNSLIYGCDPENRRQAKQAESSIYLMKKLTCPAVVVGIAGFLSNAEEEVEAEPVRTALKNLPPAHARIATPCE